jgi:hypothetical protein
MVYLNQAGLHACHAKGTGTMKKRAVWICAGATAAAAILIAALLVFTGVLPVFQPSQPSLNGARNNMLGGFATSDEKYVYFSEEQIGIFRMDMDGSNIVQISEDNDRISYNLIARGGRVYSLASSTSNWTVTLCRMNSDGTDKQIIKDLGPPGISMCMGPDNEFYLLKMSDYESVYKMHVIYRMKPDGTGCTELTDDLYANDFTLSDNRIYASCRKQNSSGFGFYSINPADGSARLIHGETDTYSATFCVSQGNLYYAFYHSDHSGTLNTLKRRNANGTGPETDTGVVVPSLYNVVGRTLYYEDPEKGCIYSITPDGKKTLLYEHPVENSMELRMTCIAGGWVFFEIHEFDLSNGLAHIVNDSTPQYYMMKTDGTSLNMYHAGK